MDAHTRRKSREIENSLNSNSSRLNYDLTAFLSQMFYACKTLKTTRISAEQIRENWQPNYCRPSQLELAEYLDAALASKQVYLIDGKYVFQEGGEYALQLNPPEDKRNSLGIGFNFQKAMSSTRVYLGTADPRDHR